MSNESPIRVLLVDDHVLVTDGIRSLIERGAKDAIEVVGTATDGVAAIEAVKKYRPHVVLMDIEMPRMDGIEATRQIRQQPDPPEVIILTAIEAGNQSTRAGAVGASGFLLKADDPEQIITGIYDVAAGNGALSPRISKQMLRTVGRASTGEDIRQAVQSYKQLTEREMAVADLVITGMSNKEIAKKMILSESTIKTHLASIQQKFEASNRVVVGVMVTKARFGMQGS